MTITYTNIGMKGLSAVQKFNSKIFKGVYEQEPYNIDVYRERLFGKKPLIYGAFDEKKLVGAVIAYDEGSAFYIWTMAVEPNYRGRGIGKQLINLCEQYSVKNKFKTVISKVYAVSSEMISMLKDRLYAVVKVEPSKTDSKYGCYYFSKDISKP